MVWKRATRGWMGVREAWSHRRRWRWTASNGAVVAVCTRHSHSVAARLSAAGKARRQTAGGQQRRRRKKMTRTAAAGAAVVGSSRASEREAAGIGCDLRWAGQTAARRPKTLLCPRSLAPVAPGRRSGFGPERRRDRGCRQAIMWRGGWFVDGAVGPGLGVGGWELESQMERERGGSWRSDRARARRLPPQQTRSGGRGRRSHVWCCVGE